jgi:Laminin G domain
MPFSEDTSPLITRSRLALVCVPLLVGSAAVATSPGTAQAATDQPLVFLGFDDPGADAPASTGTLPVVTEVSTLGGGALGSADGVHGSAADFPAWDGSTSPYKRVAVTVRSKDSSDPLSPGVRGFSFGADFNLDPRTEGGNDNGNNLVQRGLYGDPAQYKLQIDAGHVSCRIRGSRGTTFLRSSTTIDPGTWYSATCSRADGDVRLTVRPHGGDADSTSTPSSAGSVDMGSSSVPLSVGAKVTESGTVVAGNADQFNGRIDDVSVDIDQ